jgi:hypothetical protein
MGVGDRRPGTHRDHLQEMIMSDPFSVYRDGYYDQSVTDRDGNPLGREAKHDHVQKNQDHEEQPAKPKLIMGKPHDDR